MKRVIIPAIITVFIAAFLVSSLEQPMAQAFPYYPLGPRTDIEYWVGYPGPDIYSICIHTAWGYQQDCCAGLGLQAKYDDNQAYYGNYHYNTAQWAFSSEVGFNYVHTYNLGTHLCRVGIKYIPNNYYSWSPPITDNSQPTFNGYGELIQVYWVPGPNGNYFSSINDASAIQGESDCWFNNQDGSTYKYIYATVFQQGAMVAKSGPVIHWSTVAPTVYP
jgi:hypothetical protein